MVVTLPVSVVVPPALVVTDVSAVVPPTTPPKVVAPVVFTARVCPPFTVELREIARLPVLASVVAAPRVTASFQVCVPVVVTLPVNVVVPPALVVTDVSAVVPPTTPPKVVAPVVFTARVCPPFTVELREIARLPVLVSVVAAPRVTVSL